MSSAFETKYGALKEKLSEKFTVASLCKLLLLAGLFFYFIFLYFSSNGPFSNDFSCEENALLKEKSNNDSATTINHLLFGLLGSEKAWHYRKAYVEAWWRPKQTRGLLYLDTPPTKKLLPWSSASPPYRISENLTKFLHDTKAVAPVMIRMVHGIMEIVREDEQGFRWLVMGDDDSVFFVENMVDVLAKYDHTKYYYLGGQSEYILSNFWFSFNQGFGGAGFILSYPLAKALAKDMENCLRRYAYLNSADFITMSCIADIGVNLSPHKGNHQIDLRGDLSGFLSSHPKSPLMSLHHLDAVDPIFPKMNRFKATKHLMKAAQMDQSRMLQQTICYQRLKNWSFSTSWGYSIHIYEKLMPRSWLQKPIETFSSWHSGNTKPPNYMFNTRLPTNDSCEAPHVFYFKSIKRSSKNMILTTYYRTRSRGLSTCALTGSQPADLVSEVHVYSPATKRIEMDRCECCDIAYEDGMKKANVKFRECFPDEIIA